MTIRRTLLLAFLAVGLLPALALTLLAFTRTQTVMRAEIAQGLANQARATADDLDKLLFERLQNAVTWTHLEVMQDLRVGDVDKRLSAFLAEMKLRYGSVYVDLHVLDQADTIVASSAAAAIGDRLPDPGNWLATSMADSPVRVQQPAPGQVALEVRAAIGSAFVVGDIGTLVLQVNWRVVQGLLDSGARQDRLIVMVDAQGRVLAASASGPEAAADVLRQPLAEAWRDMQVGADDADGTPLLPGPVIVGRAHSQGVGSFVGFGWTTLVLQPRAAALAPVRQMAWSFASILLLTAAVTALLASGIATRIARPIVSLTSDVRSFRHSAQSLPAPGAGAEVAELTRAFAQLVDDLENSRQALVRAAQLVAIGEFAAVMAHEIRTPLGILRSSAQMLASEATISEESRELLGFVVSETGRLNSLVAAMLDRARTRAPQPAPTDLAALCERCLAMLAAQAQRSGATLEHHHIGGDPVADVDAEQMMQVLFNLLQNALQALDGAGSVRVTTQSEGAWMMIEIADSGSGIAAAERERMFEPFVHRREGGLGLGLAVVKQIIGAHGGDISVGVADMGGAAFRIRLPRSAASA